MREKINLILLSAPLLPLCFLLFKDQTFCLPVLSLHHQGSKSRVDAYGDDDELKNKSEEIKWSHYSQAAKLLKESKLRHKETILLLP